MIVERLADEQTPTMIDILRRAVAWFNDHGIQCPKTMSGNRGADASQACARPAGSFRPWAVNGPRGPLPAINHHQMQPLPLG
jgi:hypothetical protein